MHFLLQKALAKKMCIDLNVHMRDGSVKIHGLVAISQAREAKDAVPREITLKSASISIIIKCLQFKEDHVLSEKIPDSRQLLLGRFGCRMFCSWI